MTQPGERTFGPSTRILAGHAAALCLGLLLLMPVVGVDRGPFLPDEGPLVMQVDTLNDRGTWFAPYPLADIDPAGDHVAIVYGTHADDAIAPYPVRPMFVLLNVLPGRAFGIWGMTALAVVASAGASLVVGLTTRRIEPQASILATWLCGLGTPLFFNAFGLHGHTIGALCAAMVVWAIVRDLDPAERHRWLNGATVLVAIAVGIAVRREIAFVAVGVVLWALVAQRRYLRSGTGVLGVAAMAGAGLGFLLDQALSYGTLVTLGDRALPAATDSGMVSFVVDRLFLVYHSLLQPSYSITERWSTLAIVALAVTVVGARITARRQDHVLLVTGMVLSIGFFALTLLGPTSEIPIVPGLAVASPVLITGLGLSRRRDLEQPAIMALALIATSSVTLVLITQYVVAGWWEWGNRFLSISFPALATIAGIGWWRTLQGMSRRNQLPVGLVAIVLLVASSALALTAQREARVNVGQMVDEVVAAAEQPDSLILTTVPAVGRLDTDQLDDEVTHRWAFAEPDDLAGLIGLVESTQVRHLVIVTSSEHQIDRDEAWEGWALSGPAPLPRYRFPLEIWEATR